MQTKPDIYVVISNPFSNLHIPNITTPFPPSS